MNIVFAGTPSFALPTLQYLHSAGHQLTAIYTQPDRPAGRGRKLRASPIKEYALQNNLPVFQPTTLRGEEQALAAHKPDVMIVVAYGLILPSAVLAVPRYGCINVHASLLPRWRGAAPIARAIEAGDNETGITIMQMEAGLDTGPILLVRPTSITNSDTAETLEQRLATLGAEALLSALEQLAQGALVPKPQDNASASYAAKLQKSESLIDWKQPAVQLHRKIRALSPWPVATTTWNSQMLRLWDVGPLPENTEAAATPGTVIAADSHGLHVQTGNGVLSIMKLQSAGGRALPAGEFLNGTPVSAGDRLGT